MFAIRTLLLSSALVAAAAFSAAAEDEANAPDPRLGKEVDRICFARTINGWKSVKGEDDVVLLEKGVNDWYRVELAGLCRESDFRSALSIGIDSRPSGGCVTRGDVILVKGVGNFANRCNITKMYEWNDDLPAPADDADKGA